MDYYNLWVADVKVAGESTGKILSPLVQTRYLSIGDLPGGILTVRLAPQDDVWEPTETVLLPNQTRVRILTGWELQQFLRHNQTRLHPIVRKYRQMGDLLGIHL